MIPKTFGLRAWPGLVFRLAPAREQEPGMAQVQVFRTSGLRRGTWSDFARSSIEEFQRELVPAPHEYLLAAY